MNSATYCGADGVLRCAWAAGTHDYTAYHDHEWGRPVMSDAGLFEKLTLEAFQSGLSWRTILTKRAGFRTAFASFDLASVATMGEERIIALLADGGIVRHRGKIEATINNAARALELAADFGGLAPYFATYYAANSEPCSLANSEANLPGTSERLARDLKQRGWRFVGPTTVYAFMQACGLVNDHAHACDFHAPTESDRHAWTASHP